MRVSEHALKHLPLMHKFNAWRRSPPSGKSSKNAHAIGACEAQASVLIVLPDVELVGKRQIQEHRGLLDLEGKLALSLAWRSEESSIHMRYGYQIW